MADETGDKKEKKGLPLALQAGVFLLLTAGAAGGGWFAGNILGEQSAETAALHENSAEEEEGNEPLSVLPMPSITTNLAPPSDVWARLEADLIFAGEPDEALVAKIHRDMFAFIRTVKAHQIEGASGFRHFRSDLEDIARIRSDGKVTGLIIKTLLFE